MNVDVLNGFVLALCGLMLAMALLAGRGRR